MAMSNSALQALHLRQLRGLPPVVGVDRLAVFEAIAADFIGEAGKEARVETRGGPTVTRAFAVAPDPTRPVPFRVASSPVSGVGGPTSNVVADPVVYRWTGSDGMAHEEVLRGGPTPTTFGSGEFPALETHIFPAAYSGQGGAAQLFSELDKAGDASPFVAAIREQFSDVETVSIQFEGGQPLLHARFLGQRQQRPLELLSGGLARLSAILLAVARPTARLVLIDDIESGLHYRRFALVWRQIRDFATRADTQVFATTHSLEALDAAADAMADHPNDFALLRAARTSEGCVVGLLPGLEARQLLRSGLEVRG